MLVVRISLLRNNWTRSKEKTRCVVIFNPSPRTSIFRVLFGSRICFTYRVDFLPPPILLLTIPIAGKIFR